MAKGTRRKSSPVRVKRAPGPVTNNRETVPARKPGKLPLVEPFHVAVDRQLKSGHATYEAAEIAAREIKKRHPNLHVTVYDTNVQRHTVIVPPEAAGASRWNAVSEPPKPSVTERRKVARGKH